MITLQDVRITDDMLNTIRVWQGNEFNVSGTIEAIDNIITFIACEHECQKLNTEKEALSIIATLSFLKRELRLFDGKEKKK